MVFILNGEVLPDTDPRAVSARRSGSSSPSASASKRVGRIGGGGGGGAAPSAAPQGTRGAAGGPTRLDAVLAPGTGLGDANASLSRALPPGCAPPPPLPRRRQWLRKLRAVRVVQHLPVPPIFAAMVVGGWCLLGPQAAMVVVLAYIYLTSSRAV